jgi:hypothetical protein
MKIIFLDIDGVLNSEMYYRSVDRSIKDWSRFDPRVVDMITELVEEFSTKIVISSTWRFGAVKQLNSELTKSGLKKYLHKDWKTPQVYPSHRGTEIKMWLDEHPDVTSYVIIDDDINILNEQAAHLVQTHLEFGMQNGHLKKAKGVLSIPQ